MMDELLEKVISAYHSGLMDPDDSVRQEAIQGMLELPTVKGLEGVANIVAQTLIAIVEDSNTNDDTRAVALGALAQFCAQSTSKRADAAPIFAKYVIHASAQVALAALDGLAQIRKKVDLPVAVILKLTGALRHADTGVRVRAANLLHPYLHKMVAPARPETRKKSMS